MMTSYLTDGVRLYEIASQKTVQNYGRLGGTFSYVILRDCVTEATAKLTGFDLLALTPVAGGSPAA